jgi:SAM-dependent methyltransferase
LGRTDGELSRRQHAHWQQTYRQHPRMYDMAPSSAALHAAAVFRRSSAVTVLDLGAGHGRDSAFFADRCFRTCALDVSSAGLAQLRRYVEGTDLANRVRTVEHDVTRPLPLADAAVDGVFAHMLLCMALSTAQIHDLVMEVRRVLRPGGAFVYTVRNTADGHYRRGITHGDNIYEHGGFAVHFFDRPLVDALAEDWNLVEMHPFEEGDLPRRMWRVTQTRSATPPGSPAQAAGH